PARVVERSHAGRADADALPAVPHRQQAPGDALRQGPDHHQQEQPHVRPIVRELPLEHPRIESSIRAVLHAVAGDTNMRRLSCISLLLPAGVAVAPPRALAQSETSGTPPAQASAQPAASPAAADDSSRSLFTPTEREFIIGGRATSIDGDPARFQRYQDV